MAWQAFSRFPRERGIAASRFRAYVREGVLDPDLLLAALCELATQGYSARVFNRQVARDRIARIREGLYAAEKSAINRQDPGIRDLARQMRAAGLPLGILEGFVR